MKWRLPVTGPLAVAGLIAVTLIAPGPLVAGEAIVATNSAWLKQDSTITGDVVVNDAATGPTLAGGELQIDRNTAIVGAATADSIVTRQGASAADGFFCNELDGVPCDPPLDLPVFDFLPPFETTTRELLEDVSVGVGGFLSLDEDAYRDIAVARNGTLCFTGGVYDVRSITGGRGSRLLFAAPTVVRMDGKIFLGAETILGPGPAGVCAGTSGAPSAAEVVLYVAGANADPFESPRAAFFGGASGAQRGVVSANLYVPNGTTEFAQQTDLTGLALGRDVLLNRKSTVVEDSAFLFGNQPPVADPQDVATDEDHPLTIILTGSDPEGGDLAFSIDTPPGEGTLGPVTPVIPDPVGHCSASYGICDVDGDCPLGETCVLGQPAVDSATVVYTPGPCPVVDGVKVCPEDNFLFRVTDPEGLASEPALVGINAPGDTNPPPDPLEVVVAHPSTFEIVQDTVGSFILNGSAPCTGECDGVDDVELTFSIVAGSGPSAGVLGPLTQGSEVPQRTARVDYTPNAGFAGTDGFDFQVAGDLNGDLDTDDPGETSTATVTIEVEAVAPPQPPVADPVVATTEMDTEVSIGLSGAPGTGPLPLTLPFAALPAAASGANGGRAGERAAAGTRAGPTPIVIGAGWTATTAVPPAFFWIGTPPVLSPDGPFTFDGEACVSVTDDFLKGDQFRLLDNGQELGTTPLVPVDASSLPVGPDAAYADPTYSSGTFEVGEGSHAIDVEIVPPNSFSSGQGYIRVDPLDSAFCSDTCGLTFSI
ncbi:MAG: hypothetical protein OES32_05345, partial [Acidobacteriota bacterium]|nr:hypothetical protein [Acidobacteriota bacterium]